MDNGEEFRLTSAEQRLLGNAWRAALDAQDAHSNNADYLEGYSNGIQDAIRLHNGLDKATTRFTFDLDGRVRLFRKPT